MAKTGFRDYEADKSEKKYYTLRCIMALAPFPSNPTKIIILITYFICSETHRIFAKLPSAGQ